MSTADTTLSAPDLLVIGGSGFLGRHVVQRATGDVFATSHQTTPADERATWHTLDLSDGGHSAAALIEQLRPAAVINAAYISRGDGLHAITGEAPGEIARACAAVDGRFIQLSSDVVFDGETSTPYREADALNPVHDYGRAKAFAEEAVRTANPAAVIVRTSLLWGRADDPGPQVEMVTEDSITFFTDEYRNPLEVGVLADACLELTARLEISGPLHVAGANTVDRHTFARLIAPIVGVDPETVQGAPGPSGGTRPRNCPLDVSRAQGLLSTRLTGVCEALA
jgi:dTDP-4-dehydrorhamnose reductase